jgi:hypothetical protein
MNEPFERPVKRIPPELASFVSAVREAFHPSEIWLFGSRARGDCGPDSDWDLLAVLPDNAPDELMDPIATWQIARNSRPPVTLLATKLHDLREIWGVPNTLGYSLSREGVRLVD